MNISNDKSSPEIDLFDALAARVRAGQPIHVTGPLDETLGRMHLAMVNRLRADTGLPVHVIHS